MTEQQTPSVQPVGYFCDHSDEPFDARTHYDWEWDEVNGGHTFQHAPNTISAHTGVDRGYLKPEDRDRRCPRALPVYAIDVPALLARIAELEAERHTTNEALSDAAEALREKGARIAELEKALVDSCGKTWRKAARLLEDTGRDDDAVNLLDCMADAHEPGGLAHEAVSQ